MGLKLPSVIFGATSLGNLFRRVSDAEKSEIVHAWLTCRSAQPRELQVHALDQESEPSALHSEEADLPIVIDSAGKYGAGLSLEVIGRELSRLGVAPERVLISNKLAWRRVPLSAAEPTFEPGVWFDIRHDAVQDISYDGILRCWKEGNELLAPYRAGLVSVHDPDEYLAAARSPDERQQRLADVIEAYRALTELRDAGEIMATGVGAKDWTVIKELDQHCRFDWVMFANSFTIYSHPPQLVEFISELSRRGIAVIDSALFHGGFLLGGQFLDYQAIDENRQDHCRALRWRDEFHSLCNANSVTPFHVAVAFARSHPGVRSVALSSSRADRVASHLAASQTPVPDTVWQQLKSTGLIDPNYPFL
ncbi:MAG: aldo/keto reductase [Planctomycetales bacterium]|nr:aldo/keto reductase [Planctomycetales bacterium]